MDEPDGQRHRLLARALTAGDDGQRGVVGAGTHVHVHVVHAGGIELEQRLAFARFRVRHVHVLEHFRAARNRYLYGFHVSS